MTKMTEYQFYVCIEYPDVSVVRVGDEEWQCT